MRFIELNIKATNQPININVQYIVSVRPGPNGPADGAVVAIMGFDSKSSTLTVRENYSQVVSMVHRG